MWTLLILNCQSVVYSWSVLQCVGYAYHLQVHLLSGNLSLKTMVVSINKLIFMLCPVFMVGPKTMHMLVHGCTLLCWVKVNFTPIIQRYFTGNRQSNAWLHYRFCKLQLQLLSKPTGNENTSIWNKRTMMFIHHLTHRKVSQINMVTISLGPTLNIVLCCYEMVHHYIILHTTLQWLRQNINPH